MCSENFIEFVNIEKRFPGVVALSDISFAIKKGEIHALCGENGAGKSTLINLCSGVLLPNKGHLCINGKKVVLDSPAKAEKLKIATVYQEVPLCLNLSIAKNIFLGLDTKKTLGLIDWEYMNSETQKIIDLFELQLDPAEKVGNLTIAEQSLVQIMKAIHMESEFLILDEPTASLSNNQKDLLFSVIRKICSEREMTILYVSHRLEEVFELTEKITVFRDGKYINTVRTEDIQVKDLIKMMVGRDIEFKPHISRHLNNNKALEVKNLNCGKYVKDVSFDLKKGEILGFAGFQGAGRSETMRALFGVDKKDSGEIFIDGKNVSIKSPKDAIKNGLVMSSESRRDDGIVPIMSVTNNLITSILKSVSRFSVFNNTRINQLCDEYVRKLNIKLADYGQKIESLSGGNQQKVIFGRCLATSPDIFICDEPTRGIDIGAKSEIHSLLIELAKTGVSIIVISSELPEIISVSDRIIVMHEGKITGELSSDEVTEEKVMMYAAKLA